MRIEPGARPIIPASTNQEVIFPVALSLGFTTGLKRLWRGIGRILDTNQAYPFEKGAYKKYVLESPPAFWDAVGRRKSRKAGN